MNAHIGHTASSAGIPCADVALAFNGAASDEDPADKGYISIDELHPNHVGHKVMADLLRGLGYGPLSTPSNNALTCRTSL